jgi:serine/threonine protein kinase
MGPAGASKTWTPGLTVGRYVLLRELARGGMAEIWLAQQPGPKGFSREVVIKRIITSGAEQPTDFEQMFFDEARLASQLTHPNIVQVYEFDEADDGTPYLVMEYLAGESLSKVNRELIALGQPMAVNRAVAIVERCAQGLGSAHRKVGATGEPLEIVHRDVSPQNIFVTYDGVVKVLDFGIARAVGRATKTSTGMVKGKVSYMAPEQADGKAVAASDVFSLGVILFELLTGRRFYGELEQMTVFKKLLADSEPFPGPRTLNPLVPESLDAIVRRMVERAPERRFRDGLEVAQALADWQRSHQASAGEPELRDLMQRLFGARIRDTQEYLASVRAGVIPDVSTPSGPGTMPGRTQSLVKPRAPVEASPAPAAEASLPLSAPRHRGPFIALGVLGVMAVAGGLFMVTRPTADTAKPLPEPPLLVDAGAAAPVLPVPPVDAGPAPSLAPSDAGLQADASPAATTPRLRTMRLSLDTQPWTKVFLGKRALGQTPLMEVSIPAGTQMLRLVNEGLGIDATVEIDGRPGEHIVKRLSL